MKKGINMAKKKVKKKKSRSGKPSKILFADIAVERLEPKKTLAGKFKKMLKRLKFSERVEKKRVGIKMHFGGNLGYTTIPPLFVRLLVQALKDAGAKSVKAMDNEPAEGIPRGYVREVIGCETVSTFGATRKYVYPEKIGFKLLDTADFGGEAVDCDFFINLAHVKGHGDCGFGGALKNIGMGVVPWETRQKIHHLEGGISYDPEKCKYCLKCMAECRTNAITPLKDKKKIDIFFHHCTYCQHCVLMCPEGAIKMENRKFEDFSKGMALITERFLKKFKREDLLFINFLTNITIFCDCWGMSTASLVPDIGILASDDIVAIETASLDMIKAENLLESGLPKGRELVEDGKHLFEKIHGKDPYLMVNYLEKYYGGSSRYQIEEIK
jgi:uncharacterized Fe-S center protein